MALTTRHAAALAAGGLTLGLIGVYLAGGLWVLRTARARGRRVAARQMVVTGPTGAGRSSGLTLPAVAALLDKGVTPSIMVTDPKGELDRASLGSGGREWFEGLTTSRRRGIGVIIDEHGALGAIPGLVDRRARPTGYPALTPTPLDRARAYNPLPAVGDAHGDAPGARLDR